MTNLVRSDITQHDAGWKPPYKCTKCGGRLEWGDGGMAYKIGRTSIVLHEGCALGVVAGMANDLADLSDRYCPGDGIPSSEDMKYLRYLERCAKEIRTALCWDMDD